MNHHLNLSHKQGKADRTRVPNIKVTSNFQEFSIKQLQEFNTSMTGRRNPPLANQRPASPLKNSTVPHHALPVPCTGTPNQKLSSFPSSPHLRHLCRRVAPSSTYLSGIHRRPSKKSQPHDYTTSPFATTKIPIPREALPYRRKLVAEAIQREKERKCWSVCIRIAGLPGRVCILPLLISDFWARDVWEMRREGWGR